MRPCYTPTTRKITSELGTSLVVDTLGLEDGPTVLVIGGHHGNEPAGFVTAGILSQRARMPKGRLVVIPQANPAACEVFQRYSPSWGEIDLNRCYRMEPSNRDAACPTAQHAALLWEETLRIRPDLVLDLHETAAWHVDCPWGAPLWAFPSNEEAEALVAATSIPHRRYPLDHAYTDELGKVGIRAVAFETNKNGRLGLRVRAHVLGICQILEAAGMTFELPGEYLGYTLGEE